MRAYTIRPRSGQEYEIELALNLTPNSAHDFYLPIWIIGSYYRRDFAKNISRLTAIDGDNQTLKIEFVDLSYWRIFTQKSASVRLIYRYLGCDVSVRGCYLDHQRGIFNPASAFIRPIEYANLHSNYVGDFRPVGEPKSASITLNFDFQGQFAHWQWAGAESLAFGSQEELDDTPFLLGQSFTHFDFKVNEIIHDFYITGDCSSYDLEQLKNDSQKACEEALLMFGQYPKAIKNRYIFLLHLTENGYGGLEHCKSTLLIHKKSAFYTRKSYLTLLGLIIHEYFHLWNVKDLKPLAYQHYQLKEEQPNDLLWLFEGFTAYFDNYLLKTSGLISNEEYWEMIADDIEKYINNPARKHQSLVQSSFEAWLKYYNGLGISYYIQGSLSALCQDLWLQKHADLSLQQVLKTLWEQYHQDGIGMTEPHYRQAVKALLPEKLHQDFDDLLTRLIHSCEDLPLKEYLENFGLDLNLEYTENASAGFKVNKNNRIVSFIDLNAPSALSGLIVNDEILSFNHQEFNLETWEKYLKTAEINQSIELTVKRDGELFNFSFLLDSPKYQKAFIKNLEQTQ